MSRQIHVPGPSPKDNILLAARLLLPAPPPPPLGIIAAGFENPVGIVSAEAFLTMAPPSRRPSAPRVMCAHGGAGSDVVGGGRGIHRDSQRRIVASTRRDGSASEVSQRSGRKKLHATLIDKGGERDRQKRTLNFLFFGLSFISVQIWLLTSFLCNSNNLDLTT